VPVPRSRSEADTVDGLERWFRDETPMATDVTVTLQPSPRATGFSCETVLFDVEWRAADGTPSRSALAARVEPSGYSLYLRHDLERQWRIIEGVGKAGTVPVPQIVGHCEDPGRYLDRPFFVMARIDGANCADAPPYSVRGWLKDAGDERQWRVVERALEVLARVHAIDPGTLPTPFLARDIPAGLAGQVAELGRYLEWVADGRSLAEFSGAYDWLRSSVPVADDETFCWGDARLGNMLFRDDHPVAVLDWEMACLAPPESDVAWWLVFDRIHTTGRGMDRLAGFPPEPEQIVLYEKFSGRTLGDLHWYQVWAALRAAALLFRFHDMLLANGMAPADPARAAYQPALRVLRDLLEEKAA
jgi:aminoglycoside phosphotransferase (APT) family kinase protein